MQLSTNMSFDQYLKEMQGVLEKIHLSLDQLDDSTFEQILELLVYELANSHVDWSELDRGALKLQFDGTQVGVVNLLLNLVKSVVAVIYDSTPEITGDLDLHILRSLLFQFSVRLLYLQSGREVHPALGEFNMDSLVATIQQKPVKLYNVLSQSQKQFLATKFPDSIVIEEDISDDSADVT